MNQTTGVENNLRHEMIQGETKEEKKKKNDEQMVEWKGWVEEFNESHNGNDPVEYKYLRVY